MNALRLVLQAIWAFLLRAFGKENTSFLQGTPQTPLTDDDLPDTLPRIVVAEDAMAEPEQTIEIPDVVYTKDLSDGFFQKLVAMAQRQGWDVGLLFPVMAHESGIRANAKNPPIPGRTAGAYGLIQLYGSHYDGVDKLSAEEQVPLISNYFKGHAPYKSAGEVYGEMYLPAIMLAKGRGSDVVLSVKGTANYEENASLDFDRDGEITIGDLEQVAQAAAKHLGPRFDEALARYRFWEGSTPGTPGGIGGKLALGAAAVVAALVIWGIKKG